MDPLNQKPQMEEVVDLRKLFFKLFSYWHYFVIALAVALICAWLYNRYATTRYRVTSTLLIEEDKKSSAIGTDQILKGFGLKSGMQNLDNQILILSSWSLIGRTLDSLPFGTEYYYRGRIKKASLYPKHPITVIQDTIGALPYDTEFKFKYLDNNKFTLDALSKDTNNFHIQASFGEKIKIMSGSFSIVCNNYKWFQDNMEADLYFILNSRSSLQENYKKRLKVAPASREATIVTLTLEGNNKEMDIDFLNKLATIFLNYNLDKKNKEANRTIDFIDNQLVGISDSLNITEGNLQKFRSSKMVMNLSAQGQVIIDQAMKLENDKARLVIESNYYSYLAEYLSKDNVGEVPIAPATMGITDPGLSRLVMDLAEVQGQYYSKSLGDKNPMQAQLAQRLKNTKDALKETLNGVKRANELAMRENRDQIVTVNSKAAALPVTERELLGIERKFKLNDVLYTFLLEKKSEAQIQKASNTPDNEIIDLAMPEKDPVSPKTFLSYLIAIIAGFGLPFVWIMLADTFNYRVRDEEDIIKITDMPISGHVPNSKFKSPNVVFEEPHSYVAEAFRSLRSRMQFFTKEIISPVILITSSMPEEGKTFTAINLAAAYSLMGKKTVLVGFDLRRPKIFTDFGIDNDQGVSTWLIGKDNLDDILKKTTYENLNIISAGPVPPNPSELTSSGKTDELLKLLKERFDCIIIDSPPIGIVSDTFYLAAKADTCLIIVRMNKTSKDMIERTVNDLKISDIKNSSLIINDIGAEVKGYGYSGKYGYGYGMEKKS
jgi:capsular exopolysaccharide synthesis family protein